MSRNVFKDPASGDAYTWERNHMEEQGGARVRAVVNMQPIKGRWRTLRAIRQQGTRDELIYKLAGQAPTENQHLAFLHFMELSLAQTIYFTHAAGGTFECLLSDYEPQRKYVVRGSRGEHYVWDYTMQLDVIAVLE